MISVCLPIGGSYGWGVAGLYLSREIAKQTEARVLGITTHGGSTEDPLIQAVSGPKLTPANVNISSKTWNVGYAFIEDIAKARANASNANEYFQHIVAGSSWCAENLREIGVSRVSVAIQGVNTRIFNPHKTRFNKDHHRFTIFSGGKLEYRKGQDLVVAAYKTLHKEYPDMHLVCSWANIWPGGAESIKRSPYIIPPNSFDDWKRTAVEMMTVNGIDPDRYELVPQTSNAQMADVYRRADVAVFPNRCEAGTNMVMTEAMACGIPVIASYATGQREVLSPSHAYCLDQGDTLEDGWFEPSVDSIRHALETAYSRRDILCDVGLAGSRFIESFTWAKTAHALISACQH